MGIQGLLPLLKSIHQQVEPRDYRGQTVAIDAYCWLHKGVYACAYELGIGSSTTVYVNYCMKRLRMLLFHNVTPIMVFDGRNLPTKADKEKERRDNRAKARSAAHEHMKKGNRSKATECFQRCVDITPEMARAVIQACYQLDVQCIVAPYEADAQLAYLQQAGIVDMVISEDSDLLTYGCTKVLFKMDAYGCGTLIDASTFGDVSAVDLSQFSMDNFRHMCILSGCDYLSSVSGVGLQTAAKLLKRCGKDPMKVISNLRLDAAKRVPSDYEKRFWLAEFTFLHQIVYDPMSKETCHLKPISSKVQEMCEDWSFLGTHNDPEVAARIASGELSLNGKEIPGFSLHKDPSKKAAVRYSQPEAPIAITAVLPKATKPAASSNRQQCFKSTTPTLHHFKSKPAGATQRKANKEGESRGNDQALLMSYGILSSPASTASPLHERPAALLRDCPASPVLDSLGERVLTDEEDDDSQPNSFCATESEEPLSGSFFSRQQPVAPAARAGGSGITRTRVSKFFATSTSLAPSSNNTLSTMLHEAAQKQCNDLDTVASGHYQPPVSATKSAATVSRFKPKALSSSWHSGQKESEEDKKKKAGTGSGAGTLSMFMYSGKRKSSEVNELPLAAESPCSPDIDNPQPSAKIARPNAGRDAHALSGVDVNTEYTSAHSPLPLGSDLSPIVTGNLHSCSARLDAARGVENIPPGSQLSDMQESPLSSTPARSNLPYKLNPGKKLLSTLSKKRRSVPGSAKRLGVGRPAAKPESNGFLPGCFDRFRRQVRPAVLINLDDSGDEEATVPPRLAVAAAAAS